MISELDGRRELGGKRSGEGLGEIMYRESRGERRKISCVGVISRVCQRLGGRGQAPRCLWRLL